MTTQQPSIRRTTLIGIFASALIATMAACSAPDPAPVAESTTGAPASSAPELSPITLDVLQTTPGYPNLPDLATVYGSAEDFNLTLEILTANGGGAANQQFAAGEGDIFVTGFSSALHLGQAGMETTILAANTHANSFVLVSMAGSDITTLQDLKGKKVGITGPAATSDQALRYELLKAGMSVDDVEYIALGGVPAIMAALEQGHVDAATVFSPIVDQAMEDGKIQIVADWVTHPYVTTILLARTEDLKADPAPFCRYLDAYKAGLDMLKNDADFAFDVARRAAGDGITDTAVQAALDNYLENYVHWDVTFTRDLYDFAKEFTIGSGYFVEEGYPTFEQLTEGTPQC